MQTGYQTSDVTNLQTQFESKSSEFDRALKSDADFADLKRIFHEMKNLHTRMLELRQHTGTFYESSNAKHP